jgi:hypothetical protein
MNSNVIPFDFDGQPVHFSLDGWLNATKIAARCSGLMKPDTHLGENARQIEVSDDQTTPLLYS